MKGLSMLAEMIKVIQGVWPLILDNLIEGIHYLMSNDSEDPQKQSDQLEALYEISTDTQKKAIDNALICICGCSLDTIINNPESIDLEES